MAIDRSLQNSIESILIDYKPELENNESILRNIIDTLLNSETEESAVVLMTFLLYLDNKRINLEMVERYFSNTSTYISTKGISDFLISIDEGFDARKLSFAYSKLLIGKDPTNKSTSFFGFALSKIQDLEEDDSLGFTEDDLRNKSGAGWWQVKPVISYYYNDYSFVSTTDIFKTYINITSNMGGSYLEKLNYRPSSIGGADFRNILNKNIANDGYNFFLLDYTWSEGNQSFTSYKIFSDIMNKRYKMITYSETLSILNNILHALVSYLNREEETGKNVFDNSNYILDLKSFLKWYMGKMDSEIIDIIRLQKMEIFFRKVLYPFIGEEYMIGEYTEERLKFLEELPEVIEKIQEKLLEDSRFKKV